MWKSWEHTTSNIVRIRRMSVRDQGLQKHRQPPQPRCRTRLVSILLLELVRRKRAIRLSLLCLISDMGPSIRSLLIWFQTMAYHLTFPDLIFHFNSDYLFRLSWLDFRIYTINSVSPDLTPDNWPPVWSHLTWFQTIWTIHSVSPDLISEMDLSLCLSWLGYLLRMSHLLDII